MSHVQETAVVKSSQVAFNKKTSDNRTSITCKNGNKIAKTSVTFQLAEFQLAESGTAFISMVRVRVMVRVRDRDSDRVRG